MGKIVSTVVILLLRVVAYNLYLDATWMPTRFSLRAIRNAIGRGDRVNADQITDEAGEYLLRAENDRRIDIEELRERCLALNARES